MFVRLCLFSFFLCFPADRFLVCNLEEKNACAQLCSQLPNFFEHLVIQSDETDHFFNELLQQASTCNIREQLENFIGFLQCLNRYDSISLNIEDKQVCLFVKRACIFEKLHLKGLPFNKEIVKNSYLLTKGNRWSLQKHEESLQAIRYALHDEGYCDGRVIDKIKFFDDGKKVAVSLSIERGSRYTIEDVHVVLSADLPLEAHEKNILAKKIEKRFSILANTFYKKSTIAEHIKRIKNYLRKKGYFTRSIEVREHLQKGCLRLLFEVSLKPTKKIVILGSHFFQESELIEKFISCDDKVFLLPAPLFLEEILSLYKAHGFMACTGTLYEEEKRLIFVINEGDRYTLTCEVKGANFFLPEYLTKKILNFFNQPFFNEDNLYKAVRSIKQEYINQGFLKVSVSTNITKNDHLSYVEVELTIEEGERSTYTRINIDGLDWLSPAFRATIECEMTEPLPLAPCFLEKQKKQLEQYLWSHGHSAKIFYEYIPATKTVQWKAQLADPVRFGRIIFTGVPTQDAAYLSKDIALYKGQPWNAHKIEHMLKKLRSLTIFDSVSAQFHDNPTLNQRDVIIHCSEDDRHEIKMRAGLQVSGQPSLYGITGLCGGSYSLKNVSGNADCLQVEAQFLKYQKDWSILYTLPRISSTYEMKIFGMSSCKPTLPRSGKGMYDLTHNGVSLTFCSELGQSTLRMLVGIEAMKIAELIPNTREILAFEPGNVDVYRVYALIEPSFFYSTLDHSLYPTKGTKLLLSFKSMIPWSRQNAPISRFLYEQAFFYPWRSLVLATRVRMGYLCNEQCVRILPMHRFYLGGAYSVRGFDTDLVPPLTKIMEGNKSSLIPSGGKVMINGSLEIRFKIYQSLYGVTFVDAGSLAQDFFADLYQRFPVYSVGWGLRYYTAVGPVRFDIGWPVPYKWKTCQWFLTFGHIF